MSWKEFLKEEADKEYYKKLVDFVQADAKEHTIYPEYKDLFTAFNLCPLDKVKILILSQDPYHGKNQAHGLAFSVKEGIPIPPSLRNIFRELNDDLGVQMPDHGCLTGWAKQGVLLTNSILTVRESSPGSHKDRGWETFSDNVIKKVNEIDRPIVFVFWGEFAKAKIPLITNKKHLIIAGRHPSPFSAHNGFFGSKPFSKINDFLIKNNIVPIDWSDL